MNVVVRSEGGAISLVVDEIGDVVEVEEDSLNRLRKLYAAACAARFSECPTLDDRLLHVLHRPRLPDQRRGRRRDCPLIAGSAANPSALTEQSAPPCTKLFLDFFRAFRLRTERAGPTAWLPSERRPLLSR